MLRRGLSCGLALALMLGLMGPWSPPAEALQRTDGIILEDGEHSPDSAVIDPAGEFAYFGTNTSPGKVVKVNLSTFVREAVIVLDPELRWLRSAVIDPAGEFAYFSGCATGTNPSCVVKIDLATFTVDEILTLETGDTEIIAAMMDPSGEFAYFVTSLDRVVRVDLVNFERDGALQLEGDDRWLATAAIDPAGEFAYVANTGMTGQDRLIKVDLATLVRVGSIDDWAVFGGFGELHSFRSVVIDPAGGFAYVGASLTQPNPPSGGWNSIVAKVDLSTFSFVGTTSAQTPRPLISAVMDPAGRFAYFGTEGSPGRVQSVDLDLFGALGKRLIVLEPGESSVLSGVIDPAGEFAYFGARADLSLHPGRVVKVNVKGPFCGDVVTEDVVLIADTGPCPDDGLVIGAPGIDIDLGGHTLLGDGSGGGHGVTLGPGIDADDVTIRNGRIAGFSNGVHLTGGSAATLRNLTAIDNLRHGVVLRTDEAEVRNLTTRRNGGHGLVADSSVRTRVRGSDSRANGGHGLNLDSDSRTVVRNTVAVDNDRHGILARADGRAVLTGNQSNRNDRVGIAVPSNRARIHGNRVVANEGLGIRAPNRPRVTGDNTARRNNQGGRQCRPPRLC